MTYRYLTPATTTIRGLVARACRPDQSLRWVILVDIYFGNISLAPKPKTKAKSSEQEIIRRCLSSILSQVVAAGRQVSFCIYLMF